MTWPNTLPILTESDISNEVTSEDKPRCLWSHVYSTGSLSEIMLDCVVQLNPYIQLTKGSKRTALLWNLCIAALGYVENQPQEVLKILHTLPTTMKVLISAYQTRKLHVSPSSIRTPLVRSTPTYIRKVRHSTSQIPKNVRKVCHSPPTSFGQSNTIRRSQKPT